MNSKKGMVKSGRFNNLRMWTNKQPLSKLILYSIIAAIVLGLLIVLIVNLLKPSPKTYDEYFETIDEVIETENVATEASGAYSSIEKQVGEDFYREQVLGERNPKYQSSIQNQVDAINLIEQNKVETRRIGGISEPSELNKYENSSPVVDPVVKQSVDESIAIAQGKSYELQLEDAIYIEPNSVN